MRDPHLSAFREVSIEVESLDSGSLWARTGCSEQRVFEDCYKERVTNTSINSLGAKRMALFRLFFGGGFRPDRTVFLFFLPSPGTGLALAGDWFVGWLVGSFVRSFVRLLVCWFVGSLVRWSLAGASVGRRFGMGSG